MSPEPHPDLKKVTPAEWESLSKRLMAFTVRFVRRRLGSSTDLTIRGGISPDDIAQNIFERVLNGARKWSPDKHGDLLDYLVGQVKSLTNHAFNSKYVNGEMLLPEFDDQTQDETLDHFANKFLSDDSENPEMIFLDEELSIERRKLVDLVFSAADGERELEELLEVYLSNEGPRREVLAEILNISPSEVTNRLKRLKRRAGHLLDAQQRTERS